MTDVGTQLSETRQRLGLALEDIAASTKLSRQTLQQVEHNRFDQLPGGIVTKGYLRAYSSAVGLNPDQVVSTYLQQRFGESAEELPMAPRLLGEPEPRIGRAVLFEILAIAALFVFYVSLGRQPSVTTAGPRPTGGPTPPGPESQFTPAERVAMSTGSGAPVVRDTRFSLEIDIRPNGPCWVSASADDRLVAYRLMQRGDRVVASAHEMLRLRVGDPQTFAYWLNGVPGRPLGQAGRPVTVQITADNYEAFQIGGSAAGRVTTSSPLTRNAIDSFSTRIASAFDNSFDGSGRVIAAS